MVAISEHLLPLVDAIEAATGQRPSYNVAWRWSSRGVEAPDGSRVRLEFAKLGKSRLTSVEAVRRFVERQTAAAMGEAPTSSQTPRARAAAIESAERQLEELGV
jgi:hypothetical protein